MIRENDMKYNRGLCKKLSCRRGASLLIALLVFFLAILSGTVALTMAASNAGRYTHEKEDQQAYLSVLSAAKLIWGRLEHVKIQFKSTMKAPPASVDQIDVTFWNKNDGSEITPDLFLADPRFQKNLKEYALNSTSYTELEFTLAISDVPEIENVYVNFFLTGDKVWVRLYVTNGEPGVPKDYQMTILLTAAFRGLGETTNFEEYAETEEGGDGYYYRNLTFQSAQFTLEEINSTGGAEGAGGTEG